MDTTEILILLGLAYLYFQNQQSTAAGGSNALLPSALQPGTSSLPSGLVPAELAQMATVAATPLQAAANQEINTKIAAQSQTITAIGGGVEAAASVLIAHLVTAGSMAGPVGAAIGAAIAGIVLLVKTLVSDTHLYANELVQKYQNPFGDFLIKLVTATSDELNARTLTTLEVEAAYQALDQAWTNYQNQLHQLAQTSTDWDIVVMQSLNFLDNQYMGQTTPNGHTLGVGGNGQYGSTPDYGMVSSWLDWFKGLLNDPDVIQSPEGA